jgi:hypothetical protein
MAIVEAIISLPEDPSVATWKRIDSRPWLNTDGISVRPRVSNVDRDADSYDVGLVDDKTPRDPYDVWPVR